MIYFVSQDAYYISHMGPTLVDFDGTGDIGVNSGGQYQDEEIVFYLNVTSENSSQIHQPAIHEYNDCKSQNTVPPEKMEASLWTTASMGSSGYSQQPVAVDVKLDQLVNGDGIYAYKEGSNQETAFLGFCCSIEFGSITVDVNGAPRESSVSYINLKFNITLDLTLGFSAVDVNIIEEGPEDVDEAANVSYNLQACECTVAKVCITEEIIYNQNSILNMCVYTSEDNDDIQINRIKDVDLSIGGLTLRAIDNYNNNAITTVGGSNQKNVLVSTRLVSAFFYDASTTQTLQVSGIATIEFTNSRKLFAFHGDQSRGLQENDAGTGSFNLGISIIDNEQPVEGCALNFGYDSISTFIIFVFGMLLLDITS